MQAKKVRRSVAMIRNLVRVRRKGFLAFTVFTISIAYLICVTYDANTGDLALFRKFHPSERVGEYSMAGGVSISSTGNLEPTPTGVFFRELVFPNSSLELQSLINQFAIEKGAQEYTIELPSGRRGVFHSNELSLLIYEESSPNWIDVWWTRLFKPFFD